eukprot:1200683-Rhodomonas_salina.2
MDNCHRRKAVGMWFLHNATETCMWAALSVADMASTCVPGGGSQAGEVSELNHVTSPRSLCALCVSAGADRASDGFRTRMTRTRKRAATTQRPWCERMLLPVSVLSLSRCLSLSLALALAGSV